MNGRFQRFRDFVVGAALIQGLSLLSGILLLFAAGRLRSYRAAETLCLVVWVAVVPALLGVYSRRRLQFGLPATMVAVMALPLLYLLELTWLTHFRPEFFPQPAVVEYGEGQPAPGGRSWQADLPMETALAVAGQAVTAWLGWLLGGRWGDSASRSNPA